MLARISTGETKEDKRQFRNQAGEAATSATVHAAMAGFNRATGGAVGKYWIDAIVGGVATIVALASKPRSGRRAYARGVAKGNLHAIISRLVYTGLPPSPVSQAPQRGKPKVAGEDEDEIRIKDVTEADY